MSTFQPVTARARFVLAVLVAMLLAVPAQACARAPRDIVQLRPGVSEARGKQIIRDAGGRVRGALPIIHGLAADLGGRARGAVRRDPRVAAVSLNARVRSLDTSIDTSKLATAYPYSVRAPLGWQVATGAGVGVAVIDTGIDGSLPDFGDGAGGSRVVASVVTNPAATTATDTYGHGTHVAGILAGNGDNRSSDDPADGKYIGIAPEANLISIKAGDDAGNATILDAIYGLQFAVDYKSAYNIRVVNLSLVSTVAESYRTDPLDAAVESAYFSGIVVVAAAGNRGVGGDAVSYAPGNDPFAISVGAVDDKGTSWRGDDSYATWSSYGTTQDGFAKPEIGAPGAHIVSTLARGSTFASLCPSCIVDGDYIRAGGTSMAAPVISGIAALVVELHPSWTPDQVKSTLIDTARYLPNGPGEVNAASALWENAPDSGANAGIVPNDLVDASSGAIDYSRSSWGRSSWGSAPSGLTADWARSSWGCNCPTSQQGGGVDATRSSWGQASWAMKWSW